MPPIDPFENLNAINIPDLWQQDAVHALRSGDDVVVDAPTGAGKTRVFELLVESRDIKGQAVFTVPTRALANDKFREWSDKGWNVGIATGDIAENLNAPVLVATLETQRERMILGDGPAFLVIDEYQMIANRVRGLTYELCIALAPSNTRLLMLSGSVSNPQSIVKWLERIGRKASLVAISERPVPLDEQPVETLDRQAHSSVTGFIAKLAAATCLNDLAPLLIFAPHRRNAEKLCRQIAAALPDDQPLNVPVDYRRDCPPPLAQALKKRVAYHHSGLPYSVRAGLIEPLAKAGQLRVIVATTGLAAGINFSVRSVFVAARTYHDGPYIREIAPDELLQMFGRAGRRGLDEQGYILTTRDSPKPMDGRSARLQRGNVVDWPTLIRVMDRAANIDQSPFDAARRLCDTLFSEQDIPLGFEARDTGAGSTAVDDHDGSERSPFSTAPTAKELLGSSGEWQTIDGGARLAPLGKAMIHSKRGWVPATQLSRFVDSQLPFGTLVRFTPKSANRPWRYLKQIVIASRIDDGPWRIAKPLIKKLRVDTRRLDLNNSDEVLKRVVRQVTRNFHGAQLLDSEVSTDQITARFDLANVQIETIIDSAGVPLIDPPQRVRELDPVTDFIDPNTREVRTAPRNSPLRAWRRLGLIERDGTPTRRGMIFSYFQRGEGLAIAAALEESDYLASEIVWHIANIRGGSRFNDLSSGASERLSGACRKLYGALDYPGYLNLGIPEGFGEGTADCLMDWLIQGRPPELHLHDFIGPGDLERAQIEWLSLLRHIAHAPDHDWNRWLELKECAMDLLDRYAPTSRSKLPPKLPGELLRPTKLRLYRV